MSKLQTITFNDQQITVVDQNKMHYVAMKPICENIGLEWSGQARKLQKAQQKYGCVHMYIPTNSGNQEMLFIPVTKLNGWLFSINPEKVKPELRDTLIKYQEECFIALHDYWNKGIAINHKLKINEEQQFQIKNAVNDLAKNAGRTHQSIYTDLYKKFRIPRYQDLPAKDFKTAMKFLQEKPKQIASEYDAFFKFDKRIKGLYLIRIEGGDARISGMMLGSVSGHEVDINQIVAKK